MSGRNVIEVERLSKDFDGRAVLDDLSFVVPRGTVFGLLGPNGAGKTTAIGLILGLLRPEEGCSRVFGEDSLRLSRRCRQRIGYLSEEAFHESELPFIEVVRYVSLFFETWDWDRTRELMERFGVLPERNLGSMSVGERRRAELLLVLAQRPDLLVLDDPAKGLDATVRREFLWAALETARDEEKTVLFTSHILTDVERVADTIAILKRGKLRALAPLDELKSRTKRLVLESSGGAEVAKLAGELSRRHEGRELILVTESFSPQLEAELRRDFARVEVEDLNLEEIFCEMVEETGDSKESRGADTERKGET